MTATAILTINGCRMPWLSLGMATFVPGSQQLGIHK